MAMRFRPQQIPHLQNALPSRSKVQKETAHDTGAVVDESILSTFEDQSGLLAQSSEALSLGLPQIDLAQSSEALSLGLPQIEQQPPDILKTHDAEVLRAQGEQASASGEWEQAISIWETLLKLKPGDAQATRQLSLAKNNLYYAQYYEDAQHFIADDAPSSAQAQLRLLWQYAPYYGDPKGLAHKAGMTAQFRSPATFEKEEEERLAKEQKEREARERARRVREREQQQREARAAQERARLAKEKQQSLEMLKTHGVEAWSQWRQKHQDIQLDLSGADLHGLDLREFDLSNVNMANANLRDTNLHGVNLSKAVLEHADLSRANLNLANLPDADLSNATLIDAQFRGADLRQAKLIKANMTNADFSEAILQEVNLTQAVSSKKTNLTGADLTEAILSGANLRGAILKGAILTNATLTKVNLIGADLTGADLHGLDLREFDLRGAALANANLSDTNLQGVNFSEAVLEHADLSRANLNLAILPDAKLSDAILVGTKLKGADLRKAKLIRANLTDADLSEALLQDVDLTQAISKKTDLTQADLTKATLTGANFRGAILSQTFFLNVDLSKTKGLEKVDHEGPSNIDIDTIARSQGKIPEAFLRSAGVPDIIIDSMLSQANHPIKYHTCFISYSSKDEVFATKLYSDLSRLGVHCVFAPESLGIGVEFKKRIVEDIQNNDKLLLIFSEHSLKSPWVKEEVEIATQKEEQLQQSVLFPFKIDNAVLTTDQDWAEKIRDKNHIGDFTSWQQPGAYLSALDHLLSDLKDGS